jgi:hypothetical protein
VQRDLEAQQQRVGARLPGLDLLLESLLVHEHRGAASREKGKCKGRGLPALRGRGVEATVQRRGARAARFAVGAAFHSMDAPAESQECPDGRNVPCGPEDKQIDSYGWFFYAARTKQGHTDEN